MEMEIQVIFISIGAMIIVGLLMAAIVCFLVTRKCWRKTSDGYSFTDNISKQAANGGRRRPKRKAFVVKQRPEIRNDEMARKRHQATNIFASLLAQGTVTGLKYTCAPIEECEEIGSKRSEMRYSDKLSLAAKERENVDTTAENSYFSRRPVHKGHLENDSLSPRQRDINSPTPHYTESDYLVPRQIYINSQTPHHTKRDYLVNRQVDDDFQALIRSASVCITPLQEDNECEALHQCNDVSLAAQRIDTVHLTRTPNTECQDHLIPRPKNDYFSPLDPGTKYKSSLHFYNEYLVLHRSDNDDLAASHSEGDYLVPQNIRNDLPSDVSEDHETSSFKCDDKNADADSRKYKASDYHTCIAEDTNTRSSVEKRNNLNSNSPQCLGQRECVTSLYDEYLDLIPDYSQLDPTKKDIDYIYKQLENVSTK